MKTDVALVGAGNLGTALAYSLHAAGIPVREIVTRKPTPRLRKLATSVGARLVSWPHPASAHSSELTARILWLTRPDHAIAATANALARRGSLQGKTVLHSSGVLSSEVLSSAQQAGAVIASAHPMKSFPTPARLPIGEVVWTVEGDDAALRVARALIQRLGGTAVRIDPSSKERYHAFASLASPLLVSLLTATEQTARESGLSRKQAAALLHPIVQQTVSNFISRGPAASFSGPFARGDAATVAAHLRSLSQAPEIARVYLALAEYAIATLPTGNAPALRKILRNAQKPASPSAPAASAKGVRN